ncbi:MAG: hypothetical protein LAO79_05885 [Acidobacteriia bacterium]|nr:hypothetical protein [Terriglobia bacterium]
MGYAVWLDEPNRLAWAQGTQEYRPMGAAVIAITGQFRRGDFLQRQSCPHRLRGSFAGFFGSLEEVNRFLRSRERPRPRTTPAYLR